MQPLRHSTFPLFACGYCAYLIQSAIFNILQRCACVRIYFSVHAVRARVLARYWFACMCFILLFAHMCLQLECDQWRAINAPDTPSEDSVPAFGSEVEVEEEDNDPESISNVDPRDIPDVPVEDAPGNSGNAGGNAGGNSGGRIPHRCCMPCVMARWC